jgi:hypothetical protein
MNIKKSIDRIDSSEFFIEAETYEKLLMFDLFYQNRVERNFYEFREQ